MPRLRLLEQFVFLQLGISELLQPLMSDACVRVRHVLVAAEAGQLRLSLAIPFRFVGQWPNLNRNPMLPQHFVPYRPHPSSRHGAR